MKDLNLAGFKSHASMPSFADDQFTIQKSLCFLGSTAFYGFKDELC